MRSQKIDAAPTGTAKITLFRAGPFRVAAESFRVFPKGGWPESSSEVSSSFLMETRNSRARTSSAESEDAEDDENPQGMLLAGKGLSIRWSDSPPRTEERPSSRARTSCHMEPSTSKLASPPPKSPSKPSKESRINQKRVSLEKARSIIEEMSRTRVGVYRSQSSSTFPRHNAQRTAKSNVVTRTQPPVPPRKYSAQPPPPSRRALAMSDSDDSMGEGDEIRDLLSTLGSQYNEVPAAVPKQVDSPVSFPAKPLSTSTPKVSLPRVLADPNVTPKSTNRARPSRMSSLQARLASPQHQPPGLADPPANDEDDSFYDPASDVIFKKGM
uniref:WH2 domain-containing protein n=1 Tax=Steinernema glaseri TaxID=37863 RepID=A0A1I8AKI2_9BILA